MKIQWKTLQGVVPTGILALCVSLIASSTQAQEEGRPGRRGDRDPQRMQQILEQFDADGDGELSREERQAAREARRERGERGARGERGERGERGAAEGQRGQRGARGFGGMDPASLFNRIDTDGDGTITRDQFVKFMEELRAQRGPRGGERGAQRGQGGPRGEGRRPGRGADRPAAEKPADEAPDELN